MPAVFRLRNVNLFGSGVYRGQQWPASAITKMAENATRLAPKLHIAPAVAIGHDSPDDDTGGREPYTVRRNGRGEYRCTCPVMTKSHAGQRAMVQRNGCKHVHRVWCSIGEHKFMPAMLADGGQECVRCGVSIAQHEYETYGPPDEPMRPDRRDY